MRIADSETLDAARLRTPALVLATAGLILAAIRFATEHDYGYDFAVYRGAGSAVVHHQSVFGPWVGQHLARDLPFTYPPLAALFGVPFALISEHLGYVLWNVASIAVLFFVVRASTPLLVRRFSNPGLALATVFVIALVLTPVQDEHRFGQVGIVLMALCFFDCAPAPTRLPRGVLVGIATAIKLVPGIFIPYLWLSGRRRAAVVATTTFVAVSLAGAAVLPGDSKSFWTSRVFDNSRVGDLGYVSNQSLNGLVVRAFGPHAHLVWLVVAAAVAGFGLHYAIVASRRGEELLGIAIVAMVGVLVSPVSWIHHLVWIVPALAVLIGAGTNRRRATLAIALAALFTVRLPYLGRSIPGGWHVAWIRAVLIDSDALLCLVLLGALAAVAVRSAPPRPTDRTHRPDRRRSLRASRTR